MNERMTEWRTALAGAPSEQRLTQPRRSKAKRNTAGAGDDNGEHEEEEEEDEED